MSNNVKKRIFYFDELRALAIVMVILCHIAVLYKPFGYSSLKACIPSFIYIVTHVAVPIFFMLSGALLLNRQHELKEFFKKRFSRILYPFIFWVIVAVLATLFLLGGDSTEVFKILLGKDRWTWFVWVMIGIYLILPVINSFVKDYGLKGCEYFLAIWLITMILQTFHKYPFYRLELSYFAGYVGYLILGYYLANKQFNISDKKMMVMGLILFVGFTLINWIVVSEGIKNVETKYLSVFTVFASIGLFLFFRYYDNFCKLNPKNFLSKIHQKVENGKAGAVIFSLSACSYGMYLTNSLLTKFIPKPVTSVKMYPVYFIAVLLISWLLVKLVSKIPKLDKFSGAA